MVFFSMLAATVLAFDPMNEMETVSTDVRSAYTLYIGMPENEFKDNFNSLPGWERLTDTHWGHGFDGIVFVRSENKGYYVKEELSIGIAGGKVYSYEVKFRTSDAALAGHLSKLAYQHAVTQLGAPVGHKAGSLHKQEWSWNLDSNSHLQIMTSESSLAAVRSDERYIVSITRSMNI